MNGKVVMAAESYDPDEYWSIDRLAADYGVTVDDVKEVLIAVDWLDAVTDGPTALAIQQWVVPRGRSPNDEPLWSAGHLAPKMLERGYLPSGQE